MDKNLPLVGRFCGRNDHNLQKTPKVHHDSQRDKWKGHIYNSHLVPQMNGNQQEGQCTSYQLDQTNLVDVHILSFF